MTAEMDKWKLPGWRIESIYDRNVLIGNWNEDRRKFERGRSHYNSTHRTDFKNYGSFKPETSIRRKCAITHEGVGKNFIFSHHGNAYKNNTISWYDQQFNGREKTESQLPPLRNWDGKIMAYVPERSDFPIQGRPTNFGLYQQLQHKWKEQQEIQNSGDYATTYHLSFVGHRPMVPTQFRKLKSTPQRLSSKLHPHQANHNLHLRSSHTNTAPERQPVAAM